METQIKYFPPYTGIAPEGLFAEYLYDAAEKILGKDEIDNFDQRMAECTEMVSEHFGEWQDEINLPPVESLAVHHTDLVASLVRAIHPRDERIFHHHLRESGITALAAILLLEQRGEVQLIIAQKLLTDAAAMLAAEQYKEAL